MMGQQEHAFGVIIAQDLMAALGPADVLTTQIVTTAHALVSERIEINNSVLMKV